jgi:hypothetical protein
MQFFFKKSKQNLKFVVVLKRHSVKANEWPQSNMLFTWLKTTPLEL